MADIDIYITMVAPHSTNSSTPSGNTGSFRQEPLVSSQISQVVGQSAEWDDRIEAHLDYLVLCGTASSVTLLESALWAAFGVSFDWTEARPGTRGRYYESNVVSPTGVVISHLMRTDSNSVDYRLSIPGGVLQSTTEAKLRDFGRFFVSIGARCTRFDWAIDDYSRVLDIDTIVRFIADGRCSGFASYRHIRTGKKGGIKSGETLYLGSLKSDSILRIYDKFLESLGKINAIRAELQTRDSVAHSYFVDYFADSEVGETFSRISKRAIGKYRFVEDVSEVLSRCPNVSWWQNFVDRIGGQIKIRQRREQSQVSDKKRWVERQVCGTLALLVRCLGVDNCLKWLSEQISEKSLIKKEKHEKFYNNWRNAKGRDKVSFSAGLDEFEILSNFKIWNREVFC